MVKLSVSVIERSFAFQNALRDRELDLRDNKIPAMENLGATKNGFDTLDFTNNDIRKLENVPMLPRLKSLLLSNNRVHRVEPGLAEFLPNLRSLVLNNNNVQELGDLEGLWELAGSLRILSLLGNPVTKGKHYRLFVIHRMNRLRYLDFQKVQQKERLEAERLFAGKQGEELLGELEAARGTFEVGTLGANGSSSSSSGKRAAAQQEATDERKKKLTKDEVARIQAAIREATTLEEVGRLERILRSGRMP